MPTDHKPTVLTRRALAGLAAALPLGAATAAAQAPGAWPNRPITLVVPFPAGGVVDGVGRILARQLERQTGVAWVVENRGGAGGTIGATLAARAQPDGYTLLCASTGIVSISPHVMDVPYDGIRSFTPIGMTGFSNGVFAIHPSVPARSVQELVAYAKANPGRLFFASAGSGTIAHLFGEMFKARAGIDIEHVPFRGSAPALTDTIAGRAHIIFDTVAIPAVREGQLVGLAVLGDAASPLLPGLPPLRDTGFGEQGVLSWFGLLGPAGMSPELVRRLSSEIETAMANREVAEGFERAGITPRFEAANAFAETIRRDHATFGEVVRRNNIRAG
jgi:tripartite-type tricarboxylate transporter receptor subunit TctC